MARPLFHPRFATAFTTVMPTSLTIWRNGTEVGTVDQATIDPVVAANSHLVPEQMLAGVRSPHFLIAAESLPFLAADELRDGAGGRYKVHHPGVIAGQVTVAVLSKVEGAS